MSGDRLEAGAQRGGVKQQQRVARPDAGDGEDLAVRQLVRAVDGDGLDVEADRLCEDIGDRALRLDEGPVGAVLHRAGQNGAGEHRHDERAADIAGVDDPLDAVAHRHAAGPAAAGQAGRRLQRGREGEGVAGAGVGERGGGREPRAEPD